MIVEKMPDHDYTLSVVGRYFSSVCSTLPICSGVSDLELVEYFRQDLENYDAYTVLNGRRYLGDVYFNSDEDHIAFLLRWS